MVRFLAIIAAVCAVYSSADAQPIDKAAAREAACAKKPTAAEEEICLDKTLTRHDGYLNDVYQELKKKLSKKDFKGLREEQLDWLEERNRCGAKTDCLETQYTDRIAVLEQMLENIAFPNKSHVEIGAGAPTDDDAEWQHSAYNDPGNKGRYTANLRFGIPETDAVAFDATCTAGSSGTFATTIISYNIEKMKEGKSVTLKVATADYNGSLDGEVYGKNIEEGVSGILVRPDYTDPFWEALASGDELTYRVKGGATADLSLKGSGKAVRAFIADCKDIAQAQGLPLKSAKSTGGPTCKDWGKIKSKTSKTPQTVTFVNKSDGYRGVMWLNFEGQPVEYANLNQGESYTVKTYLTHPWMFTDGPGNCIEIYLPKKGVSKFEIAAPSPHFGPEND